MKAAILERKNRLDAARQNKNGTAINGELERNKGTTCISEETLRT